MRRLHWTGCWPYPSLHVLGLLKGYNRVLEIGDLAPDFTLEDSSGNAFHLAALRGKSRVAILFYPQDFTSG